MNIYKKKASAHNLGPIRMQIFCCSSAQQPITWALSGSGWENEQNSVKNLSKAFSSKKKNYSRCLGMVINDDIKIIPTWKDEYIGEWCYSKQVLSSGWGYSRTLVCERNVRQVCVVGMYSMREVSVRVGEISCCLGIWIWERCVLIHYNLQLLCVWRMLHNPLPSWTSSSFFLDCS